MKIVCECGNEASQVRKDEDNSKDKFRVHLLLEDGFGIEIECHECGKKVQWGRNY